MTGVPPRLLRLLWLAALVLFVADVLFPVSTRMSRAGGIALFCIVWFGLIGLYWHRRIVRFSLLGVTLLMTVFLILPARHLPSADLLRRDYIAGLRRYDGVPYYWGGESPKGIDCSGLIRRGLIDALFLRGIRSLDAGLVRRSMTLWWHDCTAKDLGMEHDNLTVHLLDTPSIHQLDHSKILPGDLAVTRDGIHIMAYLGEKVWIEADPFVERVITLPVAGNSNSWLDAHMKIVRWTILQP